MRKFVFIFVSALILFAACSGPVKDPKYRATARPLPGKDAKTLLSGASRHIGEPYRYGGTSSRGWDCSGFVRGMYKRYLGITLPRDTEGQFDASFRIKRNNSRPGDLVFFQIRSNKPSHVGIYAGKNKFIHSSTKRGVIVSDLREDYYRKYFIGFRRIHSAYLAQYR